MTWPHRFAARPVAANVTPAQRRWIDQQGDDISLTIRRCIEMARTEERRRDLVRLMAKHRR